MWLVPKEKGAKRLGEVIALRTLPAGRVSWEYFIQKLQSFYIQCYNSSSFATSHRRCRENDTCRKYRQPLEGWPSVEDLFCHRCSQRWICPGSAELGLSPSYISKRIAILEKCLNARLFEINSMRLYHRKAKNALGGAAQVVSEMHTL